MCFYASCPKIVKNDVSRQFDCFYENRTKILSSYLCFTARGVLSRPKSSRDSWNDRPLPPAVCSGISKPRLLTKRKPRFTIHDTIHDLDWKGITMARTRWHEPDSNVTIHDHDLLQTQINILTLPGPVSDWAVHAVPNLREAQTGSAQMGSQGF